MISRKYFAKLGTKVSNSQEILQAKLWIISKEWVRYSTLAPLGIQFDLLPNAFSESLFFASFELKIGVDFSHFYQKMIRFRNPLFKY